MSSDRVHLSVVEARALGERALRGIGYDSEEARIVSDHVIDAALCGYEYSGLAKILNIPEHRRFAEPRREMRLVHETEVSALYDGGNNNGMIAMYHAAEAAIAKAAAHGIAVIGVTNSWMSGRSAYFVEMIANARVSSRSTPRAAARGGAAWRHEGGARHQPDRLRDPGRGRAAGARYRHLGLHGDRIAVARAARPAVARGGRHRPRRPPDDRRARGPRRRRAAAVRRPSGGYKGFGLALIVQAFGLLAAGGAQEGYVFIAFRPDLLLPLADLKREIAALIARVKAVPRQDGFSEIRIPGEQSARNRERLSREGLTIDRLVHDRLEALAGLNAPKTATAGRGGDP